MQSKTKRMKATEIKSDIFLFIKFIGTYKYKME